MSGASLVLAAAAALSACGSAPAGPVTGTHPVGTPSATTVPAPAVTTPGPSATTPGPSATVAFSVSRPSRPVVVVSSNETGCGGAGIAVNGRPQPPLTDQGGTVAALVDQVVRVSWAL